MLSLKIQHTLFATLIFFISPSVLSQVLNQKASTTLLKQQAWDFDRSDKLPFELQTAEVSSEGTSEEDNLPAMSITTNIEQPTCGYVSSPYFRAS